MLGMLTTRFKTTSVVLLAALTIAVPASALAWFERHQPEVVIADPYVELHTGPGRGYPVFYVAGQGDVVQVLKRRTDWFKIRTNAGRRIKEGWVHLDHMRATLDVDGQPIDFGARGLEDFSARRWEAGVTGGDFGGASSIGAYVGFLLTPNISFQLEATQILGDFSDGLMGTGNIVLVPFPGWRVSPYFTIGGGIIRVDPHTTIVQAEDREDEIVNAGIGANLYLSDRFIVRMEYKRHTVLTSRDDNEEIDQWKAGFSIFF
jgi:hypothetical protein